MGSPGLTPARSKPIIISPGFSNSRKNSLSLSNSQETKNDAIKSKNNQFSPEWEVQGESCKKDGF